MPRWICVWAFLCHRPCEGAKVRTALSVRTLKIKKKTRPVSRNDAAESRGDRQNVREVDSERLTFF